MTMPDGTGNEGPGSQYPSGPPPSYPPQGPTDYPAPPPGPPSYAQPTPPPPPSKGRRNGLVALGVLVILVIVIVGGLAFFRDRISGDVNSLQVGDCIDEPSSTVSITDVQHQPCTAPHDGEVFAQLNYTASTDYPGADAFSQYVRDQCLPLVESYTGRTLDEIDAAGLGYAYFYPTSDSWSSGDRGVTCYLEKSDGTKLVGSVRVSTASPAQN
jgi:Septum formation